MVGNPGAQDFRQCSNTFPSEVVDHEKLKDALRFNHESMTSALRHPGDTKSPMQTVQGIRQENQRMMFQALNSWLVKEIFH